jgi:hypothetical protein
MLIVYGDLGMWYEKRMGDWSVPINSGRVGLWSRSNTADLYSDTALLKSLLRLNLCTFIVVFFNNYTKLPKEYMDWVTTVSFEIVSKSSPFISPDHQNLYSVNSRRVVY